MKVIGAMAVAVTIGAIVWWAGSRCGWRRWRRWRWRDEGDYISRSAHRQLILDDSAAMSNSDDVFARHERQATR